MTIKSLKVRKQKATIDLNLVSWILASRLFVACFRLLTIIAFVMVENPLRAQTYPQIKFDPEPMKFCPLYMVYIPTLVPKEPTPFKNESPYDYNKRVEEYDRQVEEADEKNQANKSRFVTDSLKYEECLLQYRKELFAWRKRNPNWKQTAINKEVITENDILEKPIVGANYVVDSQTANLRTKPNKDATVMSKLKHGDVVSLVSFENKSWWKVEFGSKVGYVYSSNLKIDPYYGWEKKNYQSGVTPECENVNPQYDYSLDNYLRVNVGGGTDVVIKLMKMGVYKDECIRIVYVRSNDVYEIKNIPEGEYYLKIAYGKDYRQKLEGTKCIVKFTKNAQYEKGSDILDFNKVRLPDKRVGKDIYENWSVPSFELSLDVITTYSTIDSFKSDDISESEFNR